MSKPRTSLQLLAILFSFISLAIICDRSAFAKEYIQPMVPTDRVKVIIYSPSPRNSIYTKSVNEPILLDPQTKKIIHDRVCNAYHSNQYTYNEIHDYAVSMIEENNSYPRMPAPTLTNNKELDNYFAAMYGGINSTFKGLVADETYHLMIGVIEDKKCQ